MVRVTKGGMISGRVLDEAGAPVGPRVPLVAAAEGAAAGTPGSQAWGSTKDDGTFTVEGLGEFRFHVTAGGGASGFRPTAAAGLFAPGATGIEIRAAAGVALAGRLVNSAGDPMASQSLMATQEGVAGAQPSYIRVPEDGTFILKGLAPGKIRLKAYTGQAWVDCGLFEAPASGLTVTVPDK